MQIRLKIIGAGILVIFIGLFVKLFEWQIVKGAQLALQAKNQYENGRVVNAPRGSILAKDGSVWAGRGEAWMVYVSIPNVNETASIISHKLAPLFVENIDDKEAISQEKDRLENLLSKKGAIWVALRQSIDTTTKEKAEALKISGIGFERIEKRIYPEASSAAQLLGFVGKDHDGSDKGYFGLEGYYDVTLSGKTGYLSRESDAHGSPILFGNSQESLAISGVDLVTNIDKGVQLAVERDLKEGIEKYGAKGGSVVIMDPKTGKIIAMASLPSYDPIKYFNFGNDLFKNPIVSDSFEPGSIFKVIVMASALDAGAVKPETKCDVCTGPYKVDKYFIETWNDKYFPDSSMTDVIVHSDNVGMSFVSSKLGAEKMYDYLSNFGIGQTTGVDLQGEVNIPMRKRGTWNIVDLATASFGQGVAVTPIQIVRAVSAIANKGIIVTPQVIGSLKRGNWHEDIQPVVGKKVISPEASMEITQMMIAAAQYGEAKWTALKGFSVAGKTGTAQIPIAGHYDPSKTNASFVGFAPANDPKFVMLVILKEPATSPWASETAAPLWYKIAQTLFLYFGVQPVN